MTEVNTNQKTPEIEADASKLVVKVTSKILNPVRKIALITGITGQDGSYLAEFLIKKGYSVHGIVRCSKANIEHLNLNEKTHSDIAIKLHYGDLADNDNLIKLIHEIKPDEIYNLGAQSHVKDSFDLAEYTTEVNAIGALSLL